ncbi:MAG: hypothetical protein K0U93_06845 [Gammaproteobacteria bacterium]|nr:hypothetical protein [Gammaproteobacteria bacterium]
MFRIRYAFALGLVFSVTSCASHTPIIYPTSDKSVDQQRIEADVADCIELANELGATPTQSQAGQVARRAASSSATNAATGAIRGAGSGALIGAAAGATNAIVGSMFNAPKPNPTYRKIVERCLNELGHDVAGWQ